MSSVTGLAFDMDTSAADQQPTPQQGEASSVPAPPAPDQTIPDTLSVQGQQQQPLGGAFSGQPDLSMTADLASLQNVVFPPGGLLPQDALMNMSSLMPIPMALDANGLLPVIPGNDISAGEFGDSPSCYHS